MARHPRLVRRGGRYSLRAKVPDELRPILGKGEVWRSLQTADSKVALQRVRVASVEVDAEFAIARRQLAGPQPGARSLTDSELHQLVLGWFDDQQRKALEDFDTPSADEFDLANVLATLMDDEAALTEQAKFDHMSGAQVVAKALLAKNGIAQDQLNAHQFWLVVRFVQRGLLEKIRRSRDRYEGRLDEQCHDQIFREATTRRVAPEAKAHDPMRLTLAQLIERYHNDPSRAHILSRTRESYGLVLNVFQQLLGSDRPVNEITREDCRRVRDILMTLPPNATKRFPGLTLGAAAAMAAEKGLPPLHPKTVNSHLNHISAMLKWAVREEFIGRNPIEGLQVTDPRLKEKGRYPFSCEQLNAIFHAPLYTGCQDDHAGYATPGELRPRRGRFWVPLLSLWTGMRLNECCQLTVDDIVKRDGVDGILVRSSEDGKKRVKTKAGERFVPLHPVLHRIGFMEHIAKMRMAGEQRLFPDLPMGANGYYSDPFQKWFGRFLRSVGAARTKTSFHSFRHTLDDEMKEAHVPAGIIRAIFGWQGSGGMEDEYGSGYRASTLARAMDKITHPGLDLSHLYIKS